MITHPIKDYLVDLQNLIHRLQTDDYVFRSIMLGKVSIGQHIRHIIELLQCLQHGYQDGRVNYENRKRDTRIETDRHFAISCLEDCIKDLMLDDQPLILIYDNDDGKTVNSSYHRELIYNSEHAVHHMALIRVALREMDLDLVSKYFGLAAATIKFQEQACAQ